MSKRTQLPRISLSAKPKGLTFKPVAAALAKWDSGIKAKAEAGAIDILGPIDDPAWGGTNAAVVRERLNEIGPGPVVVSLNSPGGDAFEGVAIYNLLREHPGKITVKVLGLAASAASIIAMAGDKIEMGDGAFMMIHSAWGVVAGNHNDIREFANVLEQLSNSVADLYARRTGNSVKDVTKMMEAETWLNGRDAVDQGFADFAVAEAASAKTSAARTSIDLSAHVRSLAASGEKRLGVVQLSVKPHPGVTGIPTTITKGKTMTTAEMIAALEAKRQSNIARMSAIQATCAEKNVTKDEEQRTEYAALKNELAGIDDELVDLRDLEKVQLASGVVVSAAAATDQAAASAARSVVRAVQGAAQNTTTISVRPNIEPGIAMTRYIKAMVISKGNPGGALQYAQAQTRWKDQTPEVAEVLMAAVAAGDTTTATWASELVYNQNLAAAFLEYLRPKTIIGRIPGFTRVPFNVRWGSQTSGATGYWVAEGGPIPVSKYATGSGSLGIAKAAGLIVLTKELMMSSEPSAEVLTRNELTNCITQFLDQRFIAPDYAAVANTNPASVTNGVTPVPASGTAATNFLADLQTMMNQWNDADVDYTTAVWVTTPRIAMAIGLMKNSLGQKLYPDVNVNGGTIEGLPVIVSNNAKQVGSPVTGEGNLFVLLNAGDIALADEGGVTIDASGEASIQMLDNPTNATTGGTTATTMVSMFQTDSVALRAIRFMNWVKRRTTAVVYVKDAAYVAS